MFQKRHYEAIAKELGEALGEAPEGSAAEKEIHELSYRFAGMLGADNPLFDRGRFLNAICKDARWAI